MTQNDLAYHSIQIGKKFMGEMACNNALFQALVKILAQVAKAMYGWQSMIHPRCCFVTQGAKVGITGAVDGILAYDNAIEGGRLCTVDLLIKVAWFVKKVNNISNIKKS
jgi:hypothetical protein